MLKKKFDPYQNLPCNLSINDSTIDFYLRINGLIEQNYVVLDYGAGRAGWYHDDENNLRKKIRLIKGKVKELIAADIDSQVYENKACDRKILINPNGKILLENESVDLIFSDWTLEHINNTKAFTDEIKRVLKPNGWFCARTPHKFSYWALFSKLISNKHHSYFLNFIQPSRKKIDTFPTYYKLNTLNKIRQFFVGWENKSFIYPTDPSYFFNNKILFYIQKFLHRIFYKEFSGTLFVFLKKKP